MRVLFLSHGDASGLGIERMPRHARRQRSVQSALSTLWIEVEHSASHEIRMHSRSGYCRSALKQIDLRLRDFRRTERGDGLVFYCAKYLPRMASVGLVLIRLR